jgi:hypothetical protein
MSERIRCIRSAPLIKYISFARHRLTRVAMASLLPEVFPEIDHFDEDILQLWNREMISHNATFDRSQLSQTPAENQVADQCFTSLVEYVLHMHGDKILLMLEQLVRFGERMIPLIHEDATARAWFLNEHLLIHAHHWSALARQAMNLVKQLDLLALQDGCNKTQSNIWLNHIKVAMQGGEQWRSMAFMRRAILKISIQKSRVHYRGKSGHPSTGGQGISAEDVRNQAVP